ncbi:hypothetical protein RS84_01732 [Microbacterium hydrocarbonoxydans]|uniref:Uncharacterized protein n=1 Tax=Microbacterium hydrocarbonoxydans TaxID=273678 RepID=A0A0M2HUG1_9MICO|nr:hypothetical protein RS84_01732 [Microbacterium hydrocarbonoxydans]
MAALSSTLLAAWSESTAPMPTSRCAGASLLLGHANPWDFGPYRAAHSAHILAFWWHRSG